MRRWLSQGLLIVDFGCSLLILILVHSHTRLRGVQTTVFNTELQQEVQVQVQVQGKGVQSYR